MSKFNIQIDKPTPTDEQIEKYQDFDALLQQYHAAANGGVAKRMSKSPGIWAAAITLLAVIGVVFFAANNQSAEQVGAPTPPSAATQSDGISTKTLFPVSQMATPLPVSATAATQRTKLGVSIAVPASLALYYRELHSSQTLSVLEVFATRKGERYTPETATPMEISYMGGTPQPRTVYRLDDATATWKAIGKERVAEISAMAALPAKPTLESVKAKYLLENAPQAALAPPSQPFALDLDLTSLPELDAYDRVCWDYVSSSHPNRRTWDETWDNVSIARASGDLYTLTFSRRGESVNVTARALKGSAACRNAQDADMMHKSVDKKLSDAQAIKVALDMALAEWEALRKGAESQPKTYKRSFTAPSVGVYKAE